MRTIPEELVQFRKEVGSNMDNMEAQIKILQEKISSCSSLNSEVNNSISTYYNSKNKDTVLSKFSYITDIYKKISDSLSKDLKDILDGSNNLLGDIKKLDTLSREISEQEQLIETDESASEIVRKKSKEFDSLKNEALEKLGKLKSMDKGLSFVETFSDEKYNSKVSDLVGGTFEKKTFTASNGVTVKYYIYIPKFSSDVEKIPMHMYLHGSGENGDGVLNTGLPKMISDGELKPEGIVIMPQAVQGGEFYKANYQEALVELVNKTSKKYNGDLDKVSLSGYSNGAYAGYQFVGRYKDTFSAYVPISGDTVPYVIEKMKGTNTNFWIFHGKNDVRVSNSAAKKIYNNLNAEGVDSQLYIYNDEGHMDVQESTFKNKFKDKNGKTVSVLDWAMAQSKSNKNA